LTIFINRLTHQKAWVYHLISLKKKEELMGLHNRFNLGMPASPEEAAALPAFASPDSLRFAGAALFSQGELKQAARSLPKLPGKFGREEQDGHWAYLMAGGAHAESPVAQQ
jgi:hypothetical protein